MTFDETFTQASIGDYLSVSDGTPEPSKSGSLRWKTWRSHNFTGKLVEKHDTSSRKMRFELAKTAGVTAGFIIVEPSAHTFTAADEAGFLAGGIGLLGQ